MDSSGSGTRTTETELFRFGDIVVDPAAHVLLRAGVPRPVEPKAFSVLLALLHHAGELVPRDELLDAVWGHRHVTPGVLTRVVAQLRQALADDPQHPRYIETRHALGYRFVGQLEGRPPAAEVATAPPAPPVLPVRAVAESAPLPAPLPSPSPVSAARRAWRGPAVAVAVVLALAALTWAGMTWKADSPSRPATVAVLPFANLGGESTSSYFAEGLTEEMLDTLAAVGGLRAVAVPAGGPAATGGDLRALGKRLGVASVLAASVRRDGSRVRITARLSDTATGFTLWSHTYDRQTTSVFDTQHEIAGEVAHALLGAVPGARPSPAPQPALTTHSEAAFDSYLRGLQWLRRLGAPDAADRAVTHFNQALTQDARFALAQTGICRAEVWRFQSQHDDAALAPAKAACARAERMAPGLPETALALGELYRATGDDERALAYYREVIAKSSRWAPNAHAGMARIHAARQQGDLAEAEFAKALELDPTRAALHAEIGYQRYLDGKLPEAIAAYRRALALHPGDAELLGTLGALYLAAGNPDAAEQALTQAIAVAPATDSLTNLGVLRYQRGDYAGAVALQQQAVALDGDDFMVWGNLAVALRADPAATASDRDHALTQAARHAEHYLAAQPQDARAAASLALYRAMLGDAAAARTWLARAESLPGQPGEVALLDAETLALLGEPDAARIRLAAARSAGIAERLIATNDTFRRLGLVPGPVAYRASLESPAPRP